MAFQVEERIPGGSWQISPGSVQDETYATREEAERVKKMIERDYAEGDGQDTTVELRVVEVLDQDHAMARADHAFDEARDRELTEGDA